MTPQLPLESPFKNQALFSDHYLRELLPQDSRWATWLTEADTFWLWLQNLYAQEGPHLEHYNEAQLERNWFQPIFQQLGHHFETQVSLPDPRASESVKRPDYLFFPSETARQTAISHTAGHSNTETALAVGEVKAWGVPLGKKVRGGGASFAKSNPSHQIDYYLRLTQLDWGLLSNGRHWRLVHRASSYRLDTYYEIDLLHLLEMPAEQAQQASRYFYLFFRRHAFQADDEGRHFLDDVRRASQSYATELETDLRQNAYLALEYLMQGFLDRPQNRLTADDLRDIYENSLYLLYRLLFILFGESRGLLPMRGDAYRQHYSLHAIKSKIARLTISPSPMTDTYWSRLQALFDIISGEYPDLNADLNVPRYNGGLFSPQKHPFLKEKAVGDAALVQAIDLLARRTNAQGEKEFVDYRTLGVRQLGSIYEGLLEYQPRYATQAMVAVRGQGKGETWLAESAVPVNSKPTARREAGHIYLETDKGERKATGSYYTPQYIVEYIVEHTLGPLVEQVEQRVLASAPLNLLDLDETSRAETQAAFVSQLLSLKVLDPAMGSGHFLVEATDFLARKLAANPYVQADDPTADPSEEDVTLWRRRVVERCIYGVDKNPLAVELAKLSLWLATVAADKPLSFIDHHLRCGDSLVGARVAELGRIPEHRLSKAQQRKRQQQAQQMNMFAYLLSQRLPTVMGKILEITEQESDTYDSVQAKEAANQAIASLKAPFTALANLWTSAYFDHAYRLKDYQQALDALTTPDSLFDLPAIQKAETIAAERQFFHWELAFPEVFYDAQGNDLKNPGFDGVIGNPPYGLINDAHLQNVIVTRYEDVKSNNLYAAFIERGTHVAKKHGLQGWIVPTSWQTGEGYADLRAYLLNNVHFLKLIMLPFNVFPDAYIDTGVYIFKVDEEKQTYPALTYIFEKRATPDLSAMSLTAVDTSKWRNGITKARVLLTPSILKITTRLQNAPTQPLDELCETARGILVNDDFLSDSAQQETQFPFFDGGLYRYVLDWQQKTWVNYTPDLPEKPSDFSVFDTERILMRRLVSRRGELMASYASETFVNTKDIYNIVRRDGLEYDLRYLLTLLNSRLLAHVYLMSSTIAQKDDFPQVTLNGLRELLIRRIQFTTPQAERTALLAEAKARYQAGDSAGLLDFTAARLAQRPEQSDVIHDLLAHLAEEMIRLNKARQRLEGADDPFKYLDRGAKFVKFQTAFSEGLKYGQQLAGGEQLGEVHHDIDGLRLRPAPDSDPDNKAWVLEVQLKKRNPAEEWQGWLYEADGNTIAREWVATHRLILPEEVGRYYQVALSVYADFAHSKSFPGGYTRSTAKKLAATHLPAFDAAVDLAPLLELRAELTTLEAQIARADGLIDQIVYQLYGLTAEEVAIVAGSA